MILAFGIISFAYLLLMLFLLFGFGKIPESTQVSAKPGIAFSIIVAFRNEKENLPALLSSMATLEYPAHLFEIILVNDASEDNSEDICREFIASSRELEIRLVQTEKHSGSPKKDALTTAIKEAKHEYILTTDADCSVPRMWLRAFSVFIEETGAELVSGPVIIGKQNSFLGKFQELDFLGLQAATLGAFGMQRPFMCNGANLCYRKESFAEVGGFTGNDEIASGDDIFLLSKFRAAKLKTVFLKNANAIVTTTAQDDLRSLFFQRIRWAAKTSAYNDLFAKSVGVTVFLMNLLLVFGVVLLALGYDLRELLLLSFLLKFNMDFMLIYRGASFFERENSMKSYFWASIIYPFFCCAVVLFSAFSGYEWKGRKFRK